MTRTLSLDDTVRQSRVIHPDWTPHDHATYLYQEIMTPGDDRAVAWKRCREAVARVLDVSPCHGEKWVNNGRTQPVFVTRGRMAMSHVAECPAEGCGTAKPVGSTFSVD